MGERKKSLTSLIATLSKSLPFSSTNPQLAEFNSRPLIAIMNELGAWYGSLASLHVLRLQVRFILFDSTGCPIPNSCLLIWLLLSESILFLPAPLPRGMIDVQTENIAIVSLKPLSFIATVFAVSVLGSTVNTVDASSC